MEKTHPKLEKKALDYELSAQTGLSVKHLRNLERGIRKPSWMTAIRLEAARSCDLDIKGVVQRARENYTFAENLSDIQVNEFSISILTYLLHEKVSCTELSKRLMISRTTLWKWMQGKSKPNVRAQKHLKYILSKEKESADVHM